MRDGAQPVGPHRPLERSRARQLGIIVFATVVSVVASGVVLRRLLFARAIAPGQIQRGVFELRSDQVVISLSPWEASHMWPDDFLGKDRQIIVMPGRSVGVPLSHGVGYRTTDAGTSRVPYLVLGHFRRQDGRRGDLAEPMTLTLGQDARMGLIPWDPNRVWRDDETRLVELTKVCTDPSGAPALVDPTFLSPSLSTDRCG